jgi:hypothetical protein
MELLILKQGTSGYNDILWSALRGILKIKAQIQNKPEQS